MFSSSLSYYLKRLKKISLSDIVEIEFVYTYGRRASYSDAIFRTISGKKELRSLRNRLYETIEFAQHLNFNKFTFSILDVPDLRTFTVGMDKIICEKTNASEFEVTYNRPNTHRVISPVGKSITIGCLFPVVIMLIYSMITGVPSILLDLNRVSLVVKAVLLFISASILFLCSMLLYMLGNYLYYIYGLRREKINFKVDHLTSQDYPFISMTNKYLIYERYGNRNIWLWKNIVALEYSWGKTFIVDDTGVKYPIPTYKLISVISNDIFVSNIIQFAGLVKHKKRNFWVNLKAKDTIEL